jgi:prophage regulatory protein
MTSRQHIKLIRRPQVLSCCGFSKSTLYNKIDNFLFCPPIPLGERAVGYVEHEVQAVLKAMVEGRTPEEIKSLVAELVTQRSHSKDGGFDNEQV